MEDVNDTSTGKVADSWQTDNKPHDVKLAFGKTYVLSEAFVPTGYEKAQNITITVSADGSLTVDGKNVSDTNISMIDSRKPYILPSTGGPGSTRTVLAYALFAGICGLMTVSAFRMNKKKQGD